MYLARSRIQGLGLYAAKDLEKHTMVIEYIGTVIRNEVANRREKIYESQVPQLLPLGQSTQSSWSLKDEKWNSKVSSDSEAL